MPGPWGSASGHLSVKPGDDEERAASPGGGISRNGGSKGKSSDFGDGPGVPTRITFGFTELELGSRDDSKGEPHDPLNSSGGQQPRAPECNVGLGTGPGGALARSCLASTGAAVLETATPRFHNRNVSGQSDQAKAALCTPRPSSSLLQWAFEPPKHDGEGPRPPPPSLSDGPEPQGMFLGLLTNDMSPTSNEDIQRVVTHRWVFKGADDVARKGRGFCFFIWCLLDLQRNVQIEEEGDALDQKLVRACKTFVGAQCRGGRVGDMYQLLTHFISNSVVFYEWDKFLRIAFEDARANTESFLVPHLEQVWGRFCRFRGVLEDIFGVLDSRFAWKHRLPKVGDLVQEHMRRRCFSSETITRNELFAQASVRNETVKQVKFAFGIS